MNTPATATTTASTTANRPGPGRAHHNRRRADHAALTPRQSAILEFIRETIAQKGHAPTVREIAHHFGIRNPNGVVGHLQALEKKRAIVRDADEARGIRLPRQ